MESSTVQLVGVAIPTLRQLRETVLSSADTESAVNALREAGYAGGDAVYEAFEQWLGESQGEEFPGSATDLPLDDFGAAASAFFRNAGWGEVTFSHDEADGVAMVDITRCWEGASGDDSGCHVTTGLLASFFGKIAGYPVAVLETECCSGSSSRCRFLMGNADVMQYKWQEQQQ
jgi:predicted hydrocarbon binding protein